MDLDAIPNFLETASQKERCPRSRNKNMSLSLHWCESEECLRVRDSLGSEVDAFFGAEVEKVQSLPAFDSRSDVECGMLIEFWPFENEINDYRYTPVTKELRDVIAIQTQRRAYFDELTKEIEEHVMSALDSAFGDGGASERGEVLIEEGARSIAKAFNESIMVLYMEFALIRFAPEERAELDFYTSSIKEFRPWLLGN